MTTIRCLCSGLFAVALLAQQPETSDQVFRATGSVMKFAGFTAVYTEGHEEAVAKKPGSATEERSTSSNGRSGSVVTVRA